MVSVLFDSSALNRPLLNEKSVSISVLDQNKEYYLSIIAMLFPGKKISYASVDPKYSTQKNDQDDANYLGHYHTEKYSKYHCIFMINPDLASVLCMSFQLTHQCLITNCKSLDSALRLFRQIDAYYIYVKR